MLVHISSSCWFLLSRISSNNYLKVSSSSSNLPDTFEPSIDYGSGVFTNTSLSFQFFSQNDNFLFYFQAFFGALLPGVDLRRRWKLPSIFHRDLAVSTDPAIFGLHRTREADAIPIAFAILSSTIHDISLSWSFSELQASFSPSILITATTTKIPSYLDLKQMARPIQKPINVSLDPGRCHCPTIKQQTRPFTQSPAFHFQVPDSFRHAFEHCTYRPQETGLWSIHPPGKQNESTLESPVDCSMKFLEDHSVIQQLSVEARWCREPKHSPLDCAQVILQGFQHFCFLQRSGLLRHPHVLVKSVVTHSTDSILKRTSCSFCMWFCPLHTTAFVEIHMLVANLGLTHLSWSPSSSSHPQVHHCNQWHMRTQLLSEWRCPRRTCPPRRTTTTVSRHVVLCAWPSHSIPRLAKLFLSLRHTDWSNSTHVSSDHRSREQMPKHHNRNPEPRRHMPPCVMRAPRPPRGR